MKEYRVYGPPGTGKTRRAINDVGDAAAKHGAENCLVSSFTKAAATELIERNAPAEKRNIGTLHSICYRALERPTIAETKAAEFNEENPGYTITPSRTNVDEPGEQMMGGEADQLFALYQLYRARMQDRALWRADVLGFASIWEHWKERNGYYDFTDLIEVAHERLTTAPGNPRCGFIDEAQDLNALQWALVRKWAKAMEFLIIYGDDDQAIYEFTGADPIHMIGDDIPQEQKRFLTQSHRLPKRVFDYADGWIKRAKHREPKEFWPMDEPGDLRHVGGSWRQPNQLIPHIMDDLDQGRSVMVLGSSGYMLNPMLNLLRQNGLAYHNPYRRTRGDWNPISMAGGSTYHRMRAFMDGAEDGVGTWTAGQLKMWTGLVNLKGTFKHGAGKLIEQWDEEEPTRQIPYGELMQIMEGDPWGWDPPTVKWLLERCKAARQRQMIYINEIIDKMGWEAAKSPKITIGTIHSVKGGEADCVYLFPDLSRAAVAGYQASPDPVIRLFYVGLTRAKHGLRLAGSADLYAMEW